MRFNSTRAMQTIDQLSGCSVQGTGIEPTSAALLAAGLEHAGWKVEQREVSCRGVRAYLTRWLGIGFSGDRQVTRTAPPTATNLPLILARSASPSRPACRVVFVSDLGTSPSSRFRLGKLLPADRSGPALLLEMARAWPKAWSERFEPVLVAAGGLNIGFAGVREVVRLIREDWPPKPTLMVGVIAPGVGQNLTISGRPKDLLRRVQEAAESLWIPVESGRSGSGIPMGRSWPIPSKVCDYIVMRGAAYHDAKPPPVDPAALGRAAQLATEIALRWARQQNDQTA